ncbi:flagellar protein FlaG [Legionella erythra]|uniref:FlaG protein n=1 Tax=Legionella erythra TaxID=448 RepID=A0A0W0TRF9_LEGER|nr:flagellar protein FlaG [Legionella erythra]KTC98075.1 FlaG protein [Legionella erythra]
MIIDGPNDLMPLKLESNNNIAPQKVSEDSLNTPPIANKPNDDNNVQIRQALDEATGLLQTIVTDKLSEEVIRKMPPDEYLKLLLLLDKMISGSLDNRI